MAEALQLNFDDALDIPYLPHIQKLDEFISHITDKDPEVQAIARQLLSKRTNERRHIEPFNLAARAVRQLYTQAETFVKNCNDLMAQTGIRFSWPKVGPVMVDGVEPNMVRVYTNLLINYTYPIANMRDAHWTIKHEILDGFFTQVKEDLADSKRAMKWADKERTIKQLSRFEEMPIERVLTRIIELKNPQVVADFGTYYTDSRRPLEVVWCTKPEHYLDMYTADVHSCMVGNGEREWEPFLKQGVHPTSFYYYCPFTQGAYIKQGKKVVARSIIYTMANGDRVNGRIYSASKAHEQKFITSLRANGVKQSVWEKYGIQGENKIRTKFSMADIKPQFFNVPAVYSDTKTPYLCIPYFDNVSWPAVTFDASTDNFVINFNSPPNHENKHGMMPVHAFSNARKCLHCGREIGARGIPLQGSIESFCGSECAVAAGFKLICDVTREWTAGPVTPELIMDHSHPNHFATTMAAAKAMNWCPILDDILCLPDDMGSENLPMKSAGYYYSLNVDGYNFGAFRCSSDAIYKQLMQDINNGLYPNVKLAGEIVSITSKTTDRVPIKLTQMDTIVIPDGAEIMLAN